MAMSCTPPTHRNDRESNIQEQFTWFNLFLFKLFVGFMLIFFRPMGYFLSFIVILYLFSFRPSWGLIDLLAVAAFGLFVPYCSGIVSGLKGVEYYAEIHQSSWNSWMHTLFMPFTYGGFNLAIPGLLKMPFRAATKFRWLIFVSYLFHYVTISRVTTLLIALFYGSMLSYLDEFYSCLSHRDNLMLGLIVSVIALVIQEVFGHWLGGDDASRTEGIPNAILYAVFYSVQHPISQLV